jgi:hypothetical protein
MRDAVARTDTEPVSTVSHQMRAKLTNPLPMSDSACADQIVTKSVFQRSDLNVMAIS